MWYFHSHKTLPFLYFISPFFPVMLIHPEKSVALFLLPQLSNSLVSCLAQQKTTVIKHKKSHGNLFRIYIKSFRLWRAIGKGGRKACTLIVNSKNRSWTKEGRKFSDMSFRGLGYKSSYNYFRCTWTLPLRFNSRISPLVFNVSEWIILRISRDPTDICLMVSSITFGAIISRPNRKNK